MFKRLRQIKSEKLREELFEEMFDYRLSELKEKLLKSSSESGVRGKVISHMQSSGDIHEDLKIWHRAICW
jgi:hypothetical protein